MMRPLTVGCSEPQHSVAVIYKVSEQLSRARAELFTPHNVLIGPYHRRQDSYIPSTEMEKSKAVKNLVMLGVDLEGLVRVLAELVPQVRRCYAHLPENHYMSPESFTEMLLLDGCYLLSLFIEFRPQRGAPDNEQMIGAKDMTLVRDILYLLENQMPLFVLQRILDHLTGSEEAAISALECIARPVKQLLQQRLYIGEMRTQQAQPSEPGPSDLLHLVYSNFTRPPPSEEERRPFTVTGRWRRATEYSRYDALRFRRRVFSVTDEWTILDIHIEGGTLYIPFLRIDSNTWTMLHNMIALEVEERPHRTPVTAYCIFMSHLACTAEDVQLLRRAGIVDHILSNDEYVAQGFANLSCGMVLNMDNPDQNYLHFLWHHHHLEEWRRKPSGRSALRCCCTVLRNCCPGGASGGSSENAMDTGTELMDLPMVGFSHQQSLPVEVPLPPAAIPKVREQLRRVRPELLTPQNVPIGPYYRQSKDSFSLPMRMQEKRKDDVLANLLNNLSVDQAKMEDVVLPLLLHPHVIGCYKDLPEHYSKDPKAFNTMLLRDGCYLLSLFIKHWPQTATTGNLGGGNGVPKILTQHDILVQDMLYLVENQIPLLVLQELLNYLRGPLRLQQECFFESMARPVEILLQQQLYISKTTRPVPYEPTSSDLLHLVHYYFRRPHGDAPQCSRVGRWRRAIDYRRHADLRFRCAAFESNEEWTILDINLQGGTLYVPSLRVDSSTWTMLRNLMALELEEQREQRPVTAYCLFMSQVACTAEDVELLRRAGIVDHFLSNDEEVAKGFTDLCDGVKRDMDNLDLNYLKPVWYQLDKRCRKSVHTFKGLFREKYCGNLFQRMVFSIALFVFVTQVLQVVYAALAYHKPPK
ncbi:unnamed protein product [Urochloa humidicola]